MTDIAITVARDKWQGFLQSLGDQPFGRLHVFDLFGDRPPASQGDYLYVVAHGRLRCAFLIDRVLPHRGHWQVVGVFVRPTTLPLDMAGFSEWRRRWWPPAKEEPFAAWRTEAVGTLAPVPDYAHDKTRAEQSGASA